MDNVALNVFTHVLMNLPDGSLRTCSARLIIDLNNSLLVSGSSSFSTSPIASLDLGRKSHAITITSDDSQRLLTNNRVVKIGSAHTSSSPCREFTIV